VAHELFALVGDMHVFSKQLADLKPNLRDPLLESLQKGAQRGGGGGAATPARAVGGAAGRAALGASGSQTPGGHIYIYIYRYKYRYRGVYL